MFGHRNLAAQFTHRVLTEPKSRGNLHARRRELAPVGIRQVLWIISLPAEYLCTIFVVETLYDEPYITELPYLAFVQPRHETGCQPQTSRRLCVRPSAGRVVPHAVGARGADEPGAVP